MSLVDNKHSRAAGLTGLYGTLSTSPHGVVVSDPCDLRPRLVLPWNHLHQFHLAATGRETDEKRICVLHTSGEFYAGAGQLYVFCFRAPQLLQALNLRGRMRRFYALQSPALVSHRRLSRSEGDLYARDSESLRDSGFSSESPPDDIVPKTDSKHVRVSIASDDSGLALGNKTAFAAASEFDNPFAEDRLGPLHLNTRKRLSPRRESNVSIASGVYEEISEEDPPRSERLRSPNHYEDPTDIVFGSSRRIGRRVTPPPLPPRRFRDGFRADSYSDDALDDFLPDSPLTPASFSSLLDTLAKSLPFLPRCHTMPSSNSFAESPVEPHYVPMSPAIRADNGYVPMSPAIRADNGYVPMSPADRMFFPDDDSFYMDMNGCNKNNKIE